MNLPNSHHKVILFFSNYFIHSSVIFRKDAVGDLLYRGEPAEDFGMIQTIARKWKVGNLPEILVKYRVHGNNVSLRKEQQLRNSVGMFFAQQLDLMGMNYSNVELQLHVSLAHGPYLHSELPNVAKWLEKLNSQNKKSGYFDGQLFLNYCALFFRQYCEKSGSGLKGSNYYNSLQWVKGAELSLLGKFKFYTKSVLSTLK